MRFPAIFLTCLPLVAGFGAAAQSQQLATATPNQDVREIQGIIEGAARNDADWRKKADDYIRGEQRPTFGNRAHASDRTIRLLEAVDERCRRGDCVTGRQALGAASVAQSPASEVARIGKSNVCSAYLINASGVKRWDVPPGSVVFDFMPRGVRPSAGAIPIIPGDARLTGGPRGERYDNDYLLTGDSLLQVRGFKTAVPPGQLRVILLGSTQQRVAGMRQPFGPSLEVNGRNLELLSAAPDRWLQRGVLIGRDRNESIAPTNPLSGSAPAIVFETESDVGQLTLGFPNGAEIAAVIVEPANQPTSFQLDGGAPNAVASNATCLDEQEKIDRALAKLPSGRPTPSTTSTVDPGPKPPIPTPLSKS